MRDKISWNEGWLFHEGEIEVSFPSYKGAAYSQAKTERKLMGPACRCCADRPDSYGGTQELKAEIWESVMLPHDYVIRQTPDQQYNNARGYFKYQNSWYRKHFKLTEADRNRRIAVYFEGCAGWATVYLNGCLIKRNFCGYTSFEADLTDYVDFTAENVLAVHLDVLSQNEGWWYEGSGIYRPVWLVKTEKIAVDLWGLYVHPECGEQDVWNTPVDVTLRNDGDAEKAVRVEIVLSNPDGDMAASGMKEIRIPPREKAEMRQEFTVTEPVRWDIFAPRQYIAQAAVYADGVKVDQVSVKYGYRTVTCDPDQGFFLNGRRVMIQGVCCHQDYGLTGRAVPERVQRYRLKLLKEMGANGYRTAHYPHSESTMDALDDMGFLVMDETRWFESTEDGLRQLEMLVKRDRNRPGVIFWSIANEEPYSMLDQGCRIVDSMKAFIKKLDATRPVTAAISNSPETGLSTGHYDAIGINYNLEQYDGVHKKFPDTPIFSSECCATGTTRGWYLPDDEKRGYLCGYDRNTNSWFRGREETWKFFLKRPWVMGAFQWAGIEHRGETQWPRLCSQSGALDLYLQKKDAFYQNQSHWLNKPMLHLLPHWNFRGREGEEITLFAYCNCEEAELFVNGISAGVRILEPGDHAEWKVPYEPGEIRAVGRIDGKPAAWDVKKTSGRPYSLKLRLEDAGYEICAEEKDAEKLSSAQVGGKKEEMPVCAQVCGKEGEMPVCDRVCGKEEEMPVCDRVCGKEEEIFACYRADGKDVAILTCFCVDEDGIEVPDACPEITFETNGFGKIEATGSDVSDHVPPESPIRKMRMGLCSVLVRFGNEAGTVRVYAKAEGLETGAAAFEIR